MLADFCYDSFIFRDNVDHLRLEQVLAKELIQDEAQFAADNPTVIGSEKNFGAEVRSSVLENQFCQRRIGDETAAKAAAHSTEDRRQFGWAGCHCDDIGNLANVLHRK